MMKMIMMMTMTPIGRARIYSFSNSMLTALWKKKEEKKKERKKEKTAKYSRKQMTERLSKLDDNIAKTSSLICCTVLICRIHAYSKHLWLLLLSVSGWHAGQTQECTSVMENFSIYFRIKNEIKSFTVVSFPSLHWNKGKAWRKM